MARLAAKAKKAPKVPAIRGPKIVDPAPKKKTKKAIAGPKIVDPKPKRKTKKAIAGHTGGGMKLPEKKTRPRPKVSDTGGGLRRPKKKRPIRSGGDGLTPVRRKRAMSRRRTAMARARAGNRNRRGLRR